MVHSAPGLIYIAVFGICDYLNKPIVIVYKTALINLDVEVEVVLRIGGWLAGCSFGRSNKL